MDDLAFLLTMLVIFFFAALFIIFINLHIEWSTHKQMVRDHTRSWGKANYSIFKEYFHMYKWEQKSGFRDSLWNEELDCEYHASIIKFEGIGMIISNPISYYLVRRYVRKFINEMRHKRVDFKDQLKQRRCKKPKKDGYLVDLGDGQSIFISMEEIYNKPD